ncbi:hypothetical protein GLOTRDRAFT_135717 [Gloeophyllum trabeum ATCC 11539]|uniref:FYVE-type domain-containing protein n=1 Tax=Gloeophyllum trabeum (strain ATCC 11539 / FP-39264 / Madison 617) TaxID=670483 RepID=S7QNP6_GLOTA|nr:uncharacterized protein GLOTRDRAFT_135717 [Gloeophyllum trabeum ATCC 11539]EPQ61181.1 hypothetical protein GLOTRDRAFT_135717 [Gloeophyllum trabeum ATCC 11539]
MSLPAPLRVAILRPGSSVQSSSSASSSDDSDYHSLASSGDYAPSSSSSTAPTSVGSPSCLSEPATSPVERKPRHRTSSGNNEHLAVLLPKHLWKPDALATRCETFTCQAPFSLFQRRHHCRKCGGVFCSACTTRSTPLLDTSNLNFMHPPRNIPISVFESPISPITVSRVCDDCYQQIHNIRVRPAPPTTSAEDVPALARPRPSMRRSMTSPAVQLQRANSLSHVRPSITNEKSASYGELDAYPLRNSSAVCKATGGGRWTPRQVTIPINSRLNGCRLEYERELAREERERNPPRANPLLRDGDFQLRVPCRFEPRSPQGPPLLPTF